MFPPVVPCWFAAAIALATFSASEGGYSTGRGGAAMAEGGAGGSPPLPCWLCRAARPSSRLARKEFCISARFSSVSAMCTPTGQSERRLLATTTSAAVALAAGDSAS